jgi:hypothetical protein
MRRSQPEVSVVKVMAMATTRRMRGNCAVNMLSMRAHSCLNGISMSEDFLTIRLYRTPNGRPLVMNLLAAPSIFTGSY